jgi:hypothetical protein
MVLGRRLQNRLESLTNFLTLSASFENTLKKTQHIGQIKPEPTVYTLSIQPITDSGILPFNQHGALASQTFHTLIIPDCSINEKLTNIPALNQIQRKHEATLLYRSRLRITATQPANTPPPKIVNPMERTPSHVPDADDP